MVIIMTVILTKDNNYLPIKYQESDFPNLLNTINTLYNLNITKEIYESNINYPDIYYEYVKTYYKHINELKPNIVIIDNLELFDEVINIKYNLIEIKKEISIDQLEMILNENINY